MAIGGYGLEGSPMTNSSEAVGAPGPGGEVRAPVIDPSAEPAGPATQAGPPRRRRRLALLATTAAAVAILLVVATTGAGWYFSGQVLHIDTASYPVTVRSVAGDTVTLSRDSDTVRPIRYGLTWPGGHAVLDDSVRVNGDSVVRTVTGLSRGALTAGLHGYMDAYVFATDPTAGRGLAFTTPVMGWNATLALQARQRHLPGFLTWTAERLVERRARLSLGEFDQLDYAPRLTVPVLMFVDLSDTMVPPGPSLRFARTRPDLVTLVTTSGGNHTGSWNVDPNRYQSAVRDYFAAHG
jgi:pimeloyl-ACP methyl ester carboxylesterase